MAEKESFMSIALGFFLIVAAILVLVPLASYLIGQATGLEPLKGGPIFIAALVVIVGIMLMFMVIKWGMPYAKWNILYVGLLFGVAFFAIIKLPSWIPGMFATIDGGIATPFTMSPTTSAIMGAILLGALYWYSKK